MIDLVSDLADADPWYEDTALASGCVRCSTGAPGTQ